MEGRGGDGAYFGFVEEASVVAVDCFIDAKECAYDGRLCSVVFLLGSLFKRHPFCVRHVPPNANPRRVSTVHRPPSTDVQPVEPIRVRPVIGPW